MRPASHLPTEMSAVWRAGNGARTLLLVSAALTVRKESEKTPASLPNPRWTIWPDVPLGLDSGDWLNELTVRLKKSCQGPAYHLLESSSDFVRCRPLVRVDADQLRQQ